MMSSACVSLRPQQLKPQTHGAAIGHHTQLTATSATTVTMSPKPHKNQSGSVHQKTKNPRTVPGSAKRLQSRKAIKCEEGQFGGHVLAFQSRELQAACRICRIVVPA